MYSGEGLNTSEKCYIKMANLLPVFMSSECLSNLVDNLFVSLLRSTIDPAESSAVHTSFGQ